MILHFNLLCYVYVIGLKTKFTSSGKKVILVLWNLFRTVYNWFVNQRKPRLESETSLKGFKGERRNAWKNRNSKVLYDQVTFRYNFSQIGKVICKHLPKGLAEAYKYKASSDCLGALHHIKLKIMITNLTPYFR